ncbi:MAG: class I SAM-dependent methyltransferase [Candidatus Jacksonbacteria bacterium]|nr:class I SAM-dependent methyltransferase [Candidatus Jacksonbacteria bacterium]
MRDASPSNIEKIVAHDIKNKTRADAVLENITIIHESNESDFLDMVLTDLARRGIRDVVLSQWIRTVFTSEIYDDTDYNSDYQVLKRLNTLFEDESRFYKPTDYNFANIEGKDYSFQYQPPSVSYMPLFVELYKLYGGDFTFRAEDNAGQKRELYNKMREKLGNLKVLELGAGPGFGLHAIRKVTKSAMGLDTERFKEQPKTVSIVKGDARAADRIPAIASKQYNLIYSLDMLEGEIFSNTENPRAIIKSAHNLLAPGGLQVHAIPYKPLSRKTNMLAILIELADEYREDVIIRQKKTWPISEIRETVRERLKNSPQLYTRTLILNDNDIRTLSQELPAEIIKQDVTNGHFVFALKKSTP